MPQHYTRNTNIIWCWLRMCFGAELKMVAQIVLKNAWRFPEQFRNTSSTYKTPLDLRLRATSSRHRLDSRLSFYWTEMICAYLGVDGFTLLILHSMGQKPLKQHVSKLTAVRYCRIHEMKAACTNWQLPIYDILPLYVDIKRGDVLFDL